MPFSGYPLVTNFENASPVKDVHPAAHNSVNAAANALQVEITAIDAAKLAKLAAHQLGSTGDEPGAFIVWGADDGYTTQVDYFALLNTNGIDGTLFLTKDWVDEVGTNVTWSDTYITTAQVQAIADAGHELAYHGITHENHTAYLASNGVAAFETLIQTGVDYIESTFGVTVRTGAFPGGVSDARAREIAGRILDFSRGTKGIVTRYISDPFDVPAIDVLALSEAAIKAYVDEAVATRSMVNFLVHGGVTGPVLTTIGNVIDYAAGLGVKQGTFLTGMLERTALRFPSGASVDTQGNVFTPKLRTGRVEVTREDGTAGYWYSDIDEVSNAPYFDAPGGQAFEFRELLRPIAAFEVSDRRLFGDGVLNSTTTVTSALGGFRATDVGLTISGTGIPGGATIAAFVSVSNVTISAAATATATGVILTVGRPATTPATFWGTSTFHGAMQIHGDSATKLEFWQRDVALYGYISHLGITRSGAGGTIVIDSGSGGSNVDIKGFRARFIDQAGARFIALCNGVPTDASIANGELGQYWDSATGEFKFKGKTSGGTVVAKTVATVTEAEIREQAARPTGAKVETFSRCHFGGWGATAALTSQTLQMCFVPVVAGVTYTTAVFRSGTTAMAGGTFQNAGLYNSSLGLLVGSTVQTAAAWAASTLLTFTFTTPYLATYSGLAYLGIVVEASTPPTLTTASGVQGAMAIAPILHGSSTTGIASGVLPATAAAITAEAAPFYAYLT